MWRRQLPAYSPLPLGAVVTGALGVVPDAGTSRSSVETTLARAFGADRVLLTDSGTGALTLAIRGALAGRTGAAAAIPAYGCYNLATAADGAGAPVLLYDVDPATLAPDAASLRRALDRGARAVVLAHYYGLPADPDGVRSAARSAGAVLIEDAAQGAGATWRGSPLGSFGDVTVLSFGRGKGNTAGRGGALLAHGTDGSAVMDGARLLPSRPLTRLFEIVSLAAQWLLGRPALYAVPAALPFLQIGETVYHAPAPARPMSGVATRALGRTLPLGESETRIRRANAARLLASVGSQFGAVSAPEGAESGYLRLPLVATPAVRAAAVLPGARRLGVMPGYPRALCDLPGFAERVVNRGDAFPGARLLADRLITLPTHSLLREADLARLESWLRSAEQTAARGDDR